MEAEFQRWGSEATQEPKETQAKAADQEVRAETQLRWAFTGKAEREEWGGAWSGDQEEAPRRPGVCGAGAGTVSPEPLHLACKMKLCKQERFSV